jgi:hypothetical protein
VVPRVPRATVSSRAVTCLGTCGQLPSLRPSLNLSPWRWFIVAYVVRQFEFLESMLFRVLTWYRVVIYVSWQ